MAASPLSTRRRGQPSRAPSEQRIGRAAVEHRRPRPACQREGDVRHEPHRQRPIVDDGRSRLLRGHRFARRPGDQRHLDGAAGEMSREVGDVALEAAESVDRRDRPRDDDDAQAIRHVRRRPRGRGLRCVPTTRSAANVRLDVRASGVAEAARERAVGDQPRDVVAQAAGARRQQAGPAGQDDVAGAARVHGGDRHAERRRLRAGRGSATPGRATGTRAPTRPPASRAPLRAAASRSAITSRPDLARPALDHRPIGPVADDHERPAKSTRARRRSAGAWSPCSARACPRRGRTARRRRRSVRVGRGANGLDVHRIGNRHQASRIEPGGPRLAGRAQSSS